MYTSFKRAPSLPPKRTSVPSGSAVMLWPDRPLGVAPSLLSDAHAALVPDTFSVYTFKFKNALDHVAAEEDRSVCHLEAPSCCGHIVRWEWHHRCSATPTLHWSPTRSVCTLVQKLTHPTAEEDQCAICHAVVISCAGSGTTAAQRRPRCTGPRHGQCVHVVQARRPKRTSVPSASAVMLWRYRALGVAPPLLSDAHAALVPDTVSVYTSFKRTIVAAEEDQCAICKRRHAVAISCAGSGTIAAQRRPIHRRS